MEFFNRVIKNGIFEFDSGEKGANKLRTEVIIPEKYFYRSFAWKNPKKNVVGFYGLFVVVNE